jgi:hypothetical protein
MPLRAALLSLAVLLLAAAPARAAFDVTAFSVAPSSAAAGAHADVTIAASFPPYDAASPPQRPRNLTFHLPPGLAGDPFATPRCTEAAYRADSCPANTRIGSVAATATALIVIPVRQDVAGDLYNLVPAGGEPARLGAVLRPAGGLLGKLFVPTVITARATDGGLDSVVTDLPTELNGIQLYTERMAFTLQGRPAGTSRPFMRNPTSCKPAVSSIVATPHDTPATAVTKTSTFTPTACDALAFAPHIEGTVGADGATARLAKPPVRTIITQGGEEAGQAAVTVGLPPILGVDLTQLGRACTVEQAAARACPATARVGSVEATTPLLAQPLTGAVYLASRGPAALPGLTIQLGDPIPLRLDGSVELTPDGLKTTFTGLPDVPLSRFRLDLLGGEQGVFQLASDLCAADPPAVTAAFVAQSGRTATDAKALAVAGCTDPPHVAAAITRLRSGRPKVRVRVTAAAGAPELRQVRVLLPNALEAKPKRKGIRVSGGTGAGALPRTALKLTASGELRVTLPEGTRTVSATLAKGAVRAGRKLRRAKPPKRLRLRISVRDGDGPRPVRTLRVRPKRR